MDTPTTPKSAGKSKKPSLTAASSTPNPGPSSTPTKITWDAETDRKLLLLTFGRSVTPAEYANLSKAFPGSTVDSIRNRINKLRAEVRKLHESLGYEVPDGAVKGVGTPGKKGGSLVKRGVEDVGEEEGGTPSKKMKRGDKARVKKEGVVKKEPDSGGSDEDEFADI
jgi:hypothetical protein